VNSDLDHRPFLRKAKQAMRKAEAEERRIKKLKKAGAMEETGPWTADIVLKNRRRRLVRRLHIRKRRPGEGPMVH
jgi:hypothetical protein